MSRSCTREGDETGRLAIAPADVKAVDPAATVAIAANVAVAVVDAVAIAVANALALALALAENYVNPRKNVQNGLVEKRSLRIAYKMVVKQNLTFDEVTSCEQKISVVVIVSA
uniref:Uncharacterized protein n=1 Tax=Vespula pensylvanica TaxID=30213 RepID=A0A834UDK2_VESPE|nr:hypothetical protein H0235_005061 [Vespula pensylvanica]